MEISPKSKARRAAEAVIKISLLIIFLCLVCAGTYFAACYFAGDGSGFIEVSRVKEIQELPVIVIDPGHGGIDAGAVAPDGGVEKEINLDVALRLREMFEFLGIDCIMTRTEDKLLADESMKNHRKMTDLRNRLAVVNDVKETGREVIFVSIHMNNFSIPKYSGLQVWYSPSDEESRILAEKVQQGAKSWLDPENNREIKKATSSIYLLDHASVPSILIECGFLSNPEEYAKLSTAQYRNELALVICASLCDAVNIK